MELSILILTYNEAGNIMPLISGIRKNLASQGLDYEFVVVDAGSTDTTMEEVRRSGVEKRFRQSLPGYGAALQEGFRKCEGLYVATIDADYSHDPSYLTAMLDRRHDAELVIASRYCNGGKAEMPWWRKMLSIALSTVYRNVLSLPVRDLSSGYRLYQREILEGLALSSKDFDILEEILIKVYLKGGTIAEIPFYFKPRLYGKSHVRLFQFGLSYLKTLFRMWRLRYY